MRQAPLSRGLIAALPLAAALAGCSDPEPTRPDAFGRVDGAALGIQSFTLTLNDAATQIPFLDARLKVSCDAGEPLTGFYAFLVFENAAALKLNAPMDATDSTAPVQVAAGVTDRGCHYEGGNVVGTVTITSFSTDTNIVEGSFNLSVTNSKTFSPGCEARPPIGKIDVGWTGFSTTYTPSFCGLDD
jgi:hypothetical protein